MIWKRLITLGILLPQTLRAQSVEPSLRVYDEPSIARDKAKPFQLKVEYGQNQVGGRASYLNRSSHFGAKYENGLDEVRLNADGSYLRSKGETVDFRRHAFFGYDRYIGSRLWLFLLHDWESNRVVGLNYTQLSGGGLKVDILRNAVYTLNLGVAYLKRAKQTEYEATLLDANNETYTDSRVTTKDDKVISTRLKFNYDSERTHFGLLAFYQPVTRKNMDPVSGERKRDESWSLEASLAWDLTRNVYLKYAYFYRSESLQTAPGIPRYDEKTSVQIGYEF